MRQQAGTASAHWHGDRAPWCCRYHSWSRRLSALHRATSVLYSFSFSRRCARTSTLGGGVEWGGVSSLVGARWQIKCKGVGTAGWVLGLQGS